MYTSALPRIVGRGVPVFDVEEVPRWVAEVPSLSTERLDRIRKLRLYHRAGIAFVWLVHPVHHTLEVYERREAGDQLLETYEDSAIIQAPRSGTSTWTCHRCRWRARGRRHHAVAVQSGKGSRRRPRETRGHRGARRYCGRRPRTGPSDIERLL